LGQRKIAEFILRSREIKSEWFASAVTRSISGLKASGATNAKSVVKEFP
jgi:hypothetical protein